MLSISVCRTLSELSSIEDSWRRLVTGTGSTNVFLSFAWCETWARHFARDGTLRILQIHDGARLVAIAPFVLTQGCGLRTLRWVGHTDADYLGILAAPADLPEVVTALLDWLDVHRSEWDVVQWRDIDEGLLNLLVDRCPAGLRLISRLSESCPFIAIDATWEEFTARRKERFRRLRQTVSKAQRAAKIEFRYAEDLQLEADQIERDIRSIEADSWKAAQGRTLYRPDQQAFWRALLPRMLPTREITICLLDLDGVPAAYSLGFRFGNKIYGRSTAFRECYRSLSPGTVMMERIIRDAFASGCREFDFTRGNESYKNLWTTEARNSYECVMYAPALGTRVAVDLFYRRRWALRGNSFAQRTKVAYRVAREKIRRMFTGRGTSSE